MKLVSFWIEGFMSIRNLGFNLGDEVYFKYNFDEQTRILNIDAEKTNDYFDLHKGSKIRNITGILGNNGSGKTSLLKFLNVVESKKPITDCAILIFKDEAQKKYHVYNYTNFFKTKKITIIRAKSLSNCIPENNVEITDNEDPFKESNILFYSNLYSDHNDKYLKEDSELNRSVDYLTRKSLDLINVLEYNRKFDKEPEGLIRKDVQYNVLKLYFDQRLKNLLSFIAQIKTDHPELRQVLKSIPFPEYLNVNFQETLFEKTIDLVSRSQWHFEKLSEIIKHSVDVFNKEKNVSIRFQKELVFKLFLYAFKNDLFKHTKPNTSLDELEMFVKSLELNDGMFDKILAYMVSKNNDRTLYQISKLNLILTRLRDNYYNIDIEEYKIISLYTYQLKVKDGVWEFVKDINELFDIEGDPLVSFRWHSLSAGQEAILNQFTELWLGLKNCYKRNLIISIDEGELYLHPEWQRQYIGLLSDFISYFTNINSELESVQLIITSHSPFIASDIPKFNLVFLKREDPNEVNARPNVIIVNSQNHQATFGGNVFDLYKNSFFVNDFFGTYSTKWINEAFNNIKHKSPKFENSNDFSKFLQIIGEKVIKDVLLNQMQNKTDIDSYEIINLTESAKISLEKFSEKKAGNNPKKKGYKKK